MKSGFLLIVLLSVGAFAQEPDFAALKSRAESGDAAAELQLAKAYETGKGVRADKFQAADWYLKSAEHGNAEAQNTTGVLLRTGGGGRKDPTEALKWFRLAAKQGYADAMFNIGTAYYNGDGVEISDELALCWFIAAQAFGSKAADGAVQRALSELKPRRVHAGMAAGAVFLISGAEFPANPSAAVPWLKQLLHDGEVEALLPLAKLSLEGRGVPKDLALGRSYCEQGAKAKVPSAMACLGMIYQTGLGVAVDSSVAAGWYRKGAECGDVRSLYILSQLYAKGEGVKQDDVQRYVLLQVAGAASPQARREAETVKADLDSDELKKAEKKIRELREKIAASGCVTERGAPSGLKIRK